MNIDYKINKEINVDEYITLLRKSTLSLRRPVDDKVCIEGMLSNSNLLISAWWNGELVGVARSLTDFHYSCYLADLAVAEKFQKCGIGKKLQSLTQEQLGPHAKVVLLAAPAARDYYHHIGYEHNNNCWVLKRDASL